MTCNKFIIKFAFYLYICLFMVTLYIKILGSFLNKCVSGHTKTLSQLNLVFSKKHFLLLMCVFITINLCSWV